MKERGAPATAIHVRDIVKQIFGFAILHGEKVPNPADDVGPASIATFEPKDRALSPAEIRVLLTQIEKVATLPTIRLGLKLFLLTMVRKSELQDATWDEIDFERAVWTIPKERMKRSKAHNVYLSQQVLDIMIALKTCAGNSRYLLPSRYDADAPMIGQYDAQVAFGQSRALLVWNRIVLPNGRSIVLERQPGADPEGYAGLQDQVDNHWGALFKAALLSTILSVGSEAGSSNDENSLVDAIRRGASDSISQTGRQVVGRSLQVQPTITVRPGFPVRVIVTRDLVMEPYSG